MGDDACHRVESLLLLGRFSEASDEAMATLKSCSFADEATLDKLLFPAIQAFFLCSRCASAFASFYQR